MDDHAVIDDLQRRLAAAEAALRERAELETTLRESRERLHVALASAELGTFVWHVAEDRTEEDAQARAHFGLPADGTVSLAEALTTIFHPDDGPRYAAAVARAIDPAGPGRLHEEYRIRLPDGQERWMSTTAITTFEGTPPVAVRLTGSLADVTERKRAEAALQISEERQAFLLKLSDALRPLDDPAQITGTATTLLGQWLNASRAYYVEWPPGADYGEVSQDFAVPGLAILKGRYPRDVFRSAHDRISQGRTWIVADAAAEAEMEASERQYYLDNGVAAWVDVPLLKRGQVQAALCLVQDRPRHWTANEVGLAEETAERCWAAIERARAEAALRQSEARFQQFANASAAVLWIRDARTLSMEFVSPAIAKIYGAEAGLFLDSVRLWASAIIPEDREIAMQHLERARNGETQMHEFRIRRASDNSFRWIRDISFPLFDEKGQVQRIGGIAEDVTEAKLAVEHQGVLLAELQHRVRNIMGMIRSITNRTAATVQNVEDYRSRLEGRLLALARVQALLTREANTGGSLRSVIDAETRAQAEHGGQIELTGPEIKLSPKAVEVLTLAFHELATNALKYGALSVSDGRLRVSWAAFDKRDASWLALDWIEEGAPAQPKSNPDEPLRLGFGSELIQSRIPYELGGVGELRIGPDGARCHLEFPLKDGESILETDAPRLTTLFGGTLDMIGAPDLTGKKILVVEDDYYMAADAAAALRRAGAEVLGPCPSEDATRDVLADTTPTHALVDLNLGGGGPKFEIAYMLKGRGVPFVFLTGYDPEVIPPELAGVARLQKPVSFRAIVETVSLL